MVLTLINEMPIFLSPYLTASYEDMELIKSTKSDDYAYRLYDENALKRLEQILILRIFKKRTS
jgi:DNA-binding transcriptional MerR regulator